MGYSFEEACARLDFLRKCAPDNPILTVSLFYKFPGKTDGQRIINYKQLDCNFMELPTVLNIIMQITGAYNQCFVRILHIPTNTICYIIGSVAGYATRMDQYAVVFPSSTLITFRNEMFRLLHRMMDTTKEPHNHSKLKVVPVSDASLADNSLTNRMLHNNSFTDTFEAAEKYVELLQNAMSGINFAEFNYYVDVIWQAMPFSEHFDIRYYKGDDN